MQRREFITLVGGAAATWPLVAHAQQPTAPVIGFLSSRSVGESASVVEALREGLNEAGFAEGQNISIEFRWAEGQYDRLPAMAADLVSRRVALIVAAGVGFTRSTTRRRRIGSASSNLRYPELLATPVVPPQASTASLLCNTGPKPKMLERCRL
jgi:hypothetical protein